MDRCWSEISRWERAGNSRVPQDLNALGRFDQHILARFHNIRQPDLFRDRFTGLGVTSAARTKLALEIANTTLEILLAALSILERPSQTNLGVSYNHLRSTGAGVTLFEFRDATAEELVDELEFTNACLQGCIEGQEAFECVGGIELAVDCRGRGLAHLAGGEAAGRGHAIAQGNTVEHVLRRDIRVVRVHRAKARCLGPGNGGVGAIRMTRGHLARRATVSMRAEGRGPRLRSRWDAIGIDRAARLRNHNLD